jgi:hypothetical protein
MPYRGWQSGIANKELRFKIGDVVEFTFDGLSGIGKLIELETVKLLKVFGDANIEHSGWLSATNPCVRCWNVAQWAMKPTVTPKGNRIIYHETNN